MASSGGYRQTFSVSPGGGFARNLGIVGSFFVKDKDLYTKASPDTWLLKIVLSEYLAKK